MAFLMTSPTQKESLEFLEVPLQIVEVNPSELLADLSRMVYILDEPIV